MVGIVGIDEMVGMVGIVDLYLAYLVGCRSSDRNSAHLSCPLSGLFWNNGINAYIQFLNF